MGTCDQSILRTELFKLIFKFRLNSVREYLRKDYNCISVGYFPIKRNLLLSENKLSNDWRLLL